MSKGSRRVPSDEATLKEAEAFFDAAWDAVMSATDDDLKALDSALESARQKRARFRGIRKVTYDTVVVLAPELKSGSIKPSAYARSLAAVAARNGTVGNRNYLVKLQSKIEVSPIRIRACKEEEERDYF